MVGEWGGVDDGGWGKMRFPANVKGNSISAGSERVKDWVMDGLIAPLCPQENGHVYLQEWGGVNDWRCEDFSVKAEEL